MLSAAAPILPGNLGNHFNHRRCLCKMIRLVTINGNVYQKFPHYRQYVGPAGAVDVGQEPEAKESQLMPLQGVNYHIKASNSLLKTKLHLTYINDSETKVEAQLEMPSNPDLVIAKMRIKVGDKEITGVVKEKYRAREIYDDAVAGGHQAGLLQMKDQEEEKIL